MLVGRYRLVEQMARGGMGTVWVARDERLERAVAVKVLPALLVSDPSAQRRFEREARAMGRLQHPNVVSIHDVGTADPGTGEELPYLVMALVRGESLDQLISQGPLPPRRVARIFTQVASALATAHDVGVIHRDLKPSNIMVGADDHVSVLDFGLARLAQQEGRTREETLTTPGMVLGSCPYMAPEQALGQKVAPPSDIFSCGAVMYEALTGRRAFEGATPMRVLQAVVRCEVTPLVELAPAVPEALAKVVERCLAKDLERRYAHAADLARDLASLAECCEDRATAVVPPAAEGAGGDGVPSGRRGGARALAAGLVVLAVGLGAGLVVGRALFPSRADLTGSGSSVSDGGVRLRAIGDGGGIRVLPESGGRLLVAIARPVEAGSAAETACEEVLRAVEAGLGRDLGGARLFELAEASLSRSPGSREVSLAVLEVDPLQGRVRVTSAGERVGLLVEGDGRVVDLGPPGSPLGRGGWTASERALPYRGGARLVLFADCAEADGAGDDACDRASRALADRVDPDRVEELVREAVAFPGVDERGGEALILVLERTRVP